MEIKVLGGLTLEQFSKDDWEKDQGIVLQKRLYDSGLISGVQLRVGHEFTNKKPILILKQRFERLGLPFIVHGAAENLGVDFGETLDEEGRFEEYKQRGGKMSWREFNEAALTNARVMIQGTSCLKDRIIVHPGYATDSQKQIGRMKIIRELNKLKSFGLMIETLPSLAKLAGQKYYQIYGFCGVPEEMADFLESCKGLEGMIDYTHALVVGNQMKELAGMFVRPRDYERLFSDFLDLQLSNFAHFSGLTSSLEDEHLGFLEDNPTANNPHLKGLVRSAIMGLLYRNTDKDIYIALELPFHKYSVDLAKRQIDQFKRDYT